MNIPSKIRKLRGFGPRYNLKWIFTNKVLQPSYDLFNKEKKVQTDILHLEKIGSRAMLPGGKVLNTHLA